MSTRLLRLLIGLMALFLVLQAAGDPARAAPLQASTISLHMTNPTCVEALPASGMCSIQIHNLYASGSDPSFARLEILVNGKLRVYMAGFFESSAFFVDQMTPGGLKVACGGPNSAGLPDYGKSYVLTANGYMGDGTSASNSMAVFCPAYDGKTFLPLVR